MSRNTEELLFMLMRTVVFFVTVMLASCSAQRAPDSASFSPRRIPVIDAEVKQLKVPAGVSISVWAKGLENPRMMAVAADDTVYVTRNEQGDVLAIRDENERGGTP